VRSDDEWWKMPIHAGVARWRMRERRELRAATAREWSERGERRGGGDELGLGLGGTVEHDTRLYIEGEGRSGSTVTREGGRDPTTVVPTPVPAIEAGRARVVFACWDSSPTRARGPGRVVRELCLNGPCLCRPNGLSPFGHYKASNKRGERGRNDFLIASSTSPM
jgi:hypothetical protein